MYLDDVKVGEELDVPKVVMDKERMIEFAKIYDPLPLHCDEAYGKTTRFGDIIAPGVMTFMSIWSKIVEMNLFGDALIAGKSTKIEWFKPVFAEDVLTTKARFSNVTRRNPYNGIAEITVDVYNQKGELVLSDVTENIVKYRV